ncbi:6961ab59-40e4-44fc-bc31-3b36f1a2ed79 [Sclerotinia trifoliorum]|uniref:6961ab59-40e4-44fc-bc31-3b36f1a2ed79 n=1 Tax=Sclerotinia trifoliorum TaxID=28548 RepID=A0A8H2ZPJ6_9HELO|nr:6961ab59-40e4-44fc-bc31-3b36f1a2ed79 [Sclerotinia trifoliorum]
MAALPPPGDDQGDDPWAPGFERPYNSEEEREKKAKEEKEKEEGKEGDDEEETGRDDNESESGDTDTKTPPKNAETIRGTPTVTQPGLNLAERTAQETTAELFAQWEKAEQMMKDDFEAGKYTKEQIDKIKVLMTASVSLSLKSAIKKMGMPEKGAEEEMTVEQLKEKIAKLENDLKEKGQHGDEALAQLLALQDKVNQVEIARTEGEKREAKYKEQYKEAMAKVDAATKEQRERKERTDKEKKEEIRQAEARILADALRDREIAVNLLQRELTAKEEELDRVKARTQDEKELIDTEAEIRKEGEIKKEAEFTELQKQVFQKDKKVEELIKEVKALHEKGDKAILQQLDAKQKELNRIEAERQKEKESLDKEARRRRETEIKKEAEITELQREAFQKGEKVKELTKKLEEALLTKHTEATVYHTGENYVDAVKRLERENLEFRKQISKLEKVQGQLESKNAELEVSAIKNIDERIHLEIRAADGDAAVEKLRVWQVEEQAQVLRMNGLILERRNLALQVTRQEEQVIAKDELISSLTVTVEQLEAVVAAGPDGMGADNILLRKQLEELETQAAELKQQLEASKQEAIKQELEFTIKHTKVVDEYDILKKRLEALSHQKDEALALASKAKTEMKEFTRNKDYYERCAVDEAEAILKKISKQMEEFKLEEAKIKQELEATEEDLAAAEKGQPVKTTKINELKKDFQKQLEEFEHREATSKQELEATNGQLEAMKEGLATVLATAQQGQTEIHEHKKEVTALKSQLQGLQRGLAIPRLRGQVQKYKEELAEAKESIEGLKQQLTAKEQQAGGDDGAKENEISRLKQELEKLESEILRLKQIGEGAQPGQQDAELANLRREVAELKQQEEIWKAESDQLVLDMQQSVDVIKELSTEQQRLNGVIVVLEGKLAESVTAYEVAQSTWRSLEAQVLESAKTGGTTTDSQNQQAQAKRIQQLIDENKKLREESAGPGTGTGPGTGDFAKFSKRKAQSRLDNVQMLMSFMVLQRALHGSVPGDMDRVLAAVDQATIEASLVDDPRLIAEVAFWASIAEYYLGYTTGALLGFEALKDSEQWIDEERDLVKQWIEECEQGTDCPRERHGYKEAIRIGPVSDALKRPPRRPSDKARKEAKKAKKAAKKAKKAQQKSKRAPDRRRHGIPKRELYVGILSEGQQKIWDTIDFGDFNYEKLTTQQQSLFSFEPIEYEPDSPPGPPAPPPDDVPFYKLPALPPSRPGSETSDGRPPRDTAEEERPSRMGNVTANAVLHIQFLTARLANREARVQELENMHADILTITAQLDERDAQIQELRRHNQVMIAELTIWRRIGREQEGEGRTWWARVRI